MPEPRFDIVIIGAGIVGAACAAELARAGLRIAVIEADTPGSGATAAGMGHIVVMDEGDAQLALTRYSQLLWDALAAPNPAPHEYQRCGTLWVAADADELDEVAHKRDVYASAGVPCEILDADALYAHEPNLRPGLVGGLLVPGDSVVYPPRTAALLLEGTRSQGVTLIAGRAVQLEQDGVCLADGRWVRADAIVLANGIRALELAPELPMRAKKGHLAITDRYPGFVRHQLIELGYVKNAHAAEGDSVAFNVQPRSTGQVLIGSSRQFDNLDRAIDMPMLQRMLAAACAYMPGLAALSVVRVWTGVRAATADGLPLIGPHPGRSGMWLATGHEGLGITTSLGTAKLLAAQMLNERAELDPTPYLPARVAGLSQLTQGAA
jgi:glycine/D-amino acid oxidase-like deaminating enzyme